MKMSRTNVSLKLHDRKKSIFNISGIQPTQKHVIGLFDMGGTKIDVIW